MGQCSEIFSVNQGWGPKMELGPLGELLVWYPQWARKPISTNKGLGRGIQWQEEEAEVRKAEGTLGVAKASRGYCVN